MAAAAWSDLEDLKKANFKSCLAKREMVEGVLVFFKQCVLYRSVQYVIFISFGKCASSGSMSDFCCMS